MRQMSFCSRSASLATGKFPSPLRDTVRPSMFVRRKQYQVFNSVIQSIFIFMVNMLPRSRVNYQSMLILPCTWVSYFDAHIGQTIFSFMQSLTANRKLDPVPRYYLSFFSLYFRVKSLISTRQAAWGILIGVAIRSFFTHNRGTAIRTKFEQKFFRHTALYAY